MEKCVSEGLRTLGAMKMMFKVGSMSLGVKRELNEGVVVPTVSSVA